MAWDRTKPVTSTLAASGEVRSNFQAIDQSLDGGSWVADGAFLIWAAGDAAAPSHWTLQGAGALIARETAAANVKVLPFSAKLTFGTAAARIEQSLLTTANFPTHLRGALVSGGCWVKSSSPSQARISFYDGVAQTFSAYHTGGNTFEWLPVTHTLDPAATQLVLRLWCETGGSIFLSGPSALLGLIPPRDFVACPIVRGTIVHRQVGTAVVVNPLDSFMPNRPLRVEDVDVFVDTAPVGQDLICDVEVFDGAAWNSMFTAGGRPKVVAGSLVGAQAIPDAATYRYRCLAGTAGSSTNTKLRSRVSQIGTTTAGAEVHINTRVLQYARPQEVWLAPGDVS